MVLVQSLQEPSKKGRGQGQSLPNKSSVCSGKLEARDFHQHKSHRTPKCTGIRQPERSLGRYWEPVRYLRYLVEAKHH